jgi:hypothetical protein
MKPIHHYLKRFYKDETGSLAVETVIMLPVLFWAYLTMFTIFDVYRQHAINTKAAYTIGDLVSRETTPLDDSYITGVREMLAYLTSNQPEDVSERITSVRYDEGATIYTRDWSEQKGWNSRLTVDQVKALKDNLPIMPDNERVIIVETFVKYEPPFQVGLDAREIQNFVFTRPRYAPQVLWSEH